MATNQKGSRKTVRNVLTLKESLALDKILREKYTESGLPSTEFALSLNTDPELSKLFRAPLTVGMLRTALEAAEIPGNKPYRMGAKKAPSRSRLAEIEGQLLVVIQSLRHLEERFEVYSRGSRADTPRAASAIISGRPQ